MRLKHLRIQNTKKNRNRKRTLRKLKLRRKRIQEWFILIILRTIEENLEKHDLKNSIKGLKIFVSGNKYLKMLQEPDRNWDSFNNLRGLVQNFWTKQDYSIVEWQEENMEKIWQGFPKQIMKLWWEFCMFTQNLTQVQAMYKEWMKY